MAEYRRIRGTVSKANKPGTAMAVLRKLNWRGKLILIVMAAVVAVAAVIIFLPKGGPAKVSSIKMPVPAESHPLLPAPMQTPIRTPVPTTTPVVTPDPTLKRDDENEKVQELQERLMELGYLDIDETTQKFGPATEAAVKLFQRQQGFEQTGVADGETLGWLYAGDAKHYTLLEGFEGADVNRFQRRLNELGYLKKVTGYYGSETVSAVKSLQKRNDLTADGKLGENTMDLIYSPKVKPDPSVAAALKSKANVNKMIAAAEAAVGKPYVLGNEGPNSFDCSGLVYWCLKRAGSVRGRYNAAGYAVVDDWEKITSINSLKRGDLMFFWDPDKGKIGHVAIYIGSGMMIDASFSNGKVVKRSATSSWCRREFRLGRRPW